MNKEQWLNQTVQFDEWGRAPSLADVPLRYGSRAEMFELRELNNDDIKIKYQEYLKDIKEQQNE
tara:strand:+ start:2503 stop:2694 length:192 start_codon:yes stop_codon:yes gene_type:complete